LMSYRVNRKTETQKDRRTFFLLNRVLGVPQNVEKT
jgi:hypothetical protein